LLQCLTALNLKSNIASPTFTGTVGGITKAMVGLSNVDNTTDANKPVSTAGQTALDLKANIAGPTFTGDTGAANLTLSGYLRGPASFVIDPAAHGNDTGTLVVAGNLQVDGTTTTINSTTVSIDDLNFSIATDAADSAAANGAGITIGGAGASLTYSHSGTKFVLNKPLDVTGAATFSGAIDMGLNSLFTSGGYKMFYRNSSVNITYSGTSNWQVNNNADNVALMTVLDGGNVGIGNTNPAVPLDITSNSGANALRIRARTQNDYGFMSFYNNAGTAYWGEIYYTGSATAGSSLNFTVGSGVPKLTITSGGDVGIGIASPTLHNNGRALHIHNSGGNSAELHLTDNTSGSASGDGSVIHHNGANLYIQNHEAGVTQFYNSGSLALSISSGGIITTSGLKSQPNQFEIFPSSGASNRAYALALSQTVAGDFNIMQGSSATGGTYTPRLTISSGGVVNVNTTGSGTQKLQVIGGIQNWYDTNFNRSTMVGYDGIYISGAQHGYLLSPQDWVIYTGGSEKMRISSGGNVLIGSTSDVTGTHYIQKSVAANAGILYVGSSTTGRFSLVVQASDMGYNNTPATCLKIGGVSSTSRSISAAGTVNVSGNDYAEYMTKAITDNISKGDVVGINSDGLLTNIFSDAISFVIKSTDPSFVGGDIWGIESEDKDDIEEARIKVDRIAFSGQVPCNVTGASVGDYIIPVASSDGKITGEAVSNPTFEQYKISVGKVWKIMSNGNSWVAVKIG
jgi:hypothetical protein